MEKLEQQRDELAAETSQNDFYQKDTDYVTKKLAELQAVEEELDVCEERWLELEEMTE